MKFLPDKKSDKTDIEASTQSLGGEIDQDFRRPLRTGLIVLILGFGGAMAWAALAPLGQGVPATGVIKVAGNARVVQHPIRATIAAIKVDNGEQVQAGDVLVRLNPVKARAKRDAVIAKYITAKTTQARLITEATGQDEITFDPQMQKRFHDNPRYQRAVTTQKQLFEARRQLRQTERSILRENLGNTKAQLASLKKILGNRRQQIKQLQVQLEGVRILAEKGYLPRNRMLELERKLASLQAQLYSDLVEVGNTRGRIQQLKLKTLQHKRKFRKKVQAKLSQVQEQIANLAARLKALDYAVNQTVIRTPVGGLVQNMKINTVGATITPGKTLMKIVPMDTQYIVSAKLSPGNIDRVDEGLPVKITFPSLSTAWTPSIQGSVKTVSANRIVNRKTGRAFYRIEIAIADKGKKELASADIKLQPGLPATVMVKLGERSLLSYLFKPLLVKLNRALSE